tara:strand:+ start:1909 stop:2511 length:603 start_codon:yes stop_codon:yes gene_type:complete
MPRDKPPIPADAMWSKFYQTDDSPENRQKYIDRVALYSDGSAKEEEGIDKYSRLIAPAFIGDMQKVYPLMTLEEFTKRLKETAYVETHGGDYGVYQGGTPNNRLTEPKKGMPGRGWWQVEAKSARNLMDDSDKKILIGEKSIEIIESEGLTLDSLRAMDDDALGEVIAQTPAIGVMFAAALYATQTLANKQLIEKQRTGK